VAADPKSEESGAKTTGRLMGCRYSGTLIPAVGGDQPRNGGNATTSRSSSFFSFVKTLPRVWNVKKSFVRR